MLEWTLTAGITILPLLAVFWFLRNNQRKQQLREAFYRLVETEEGVVSLMQLAALARVDAEVAKAFLDEQANVFAAFPEVNPDGDTYYRFPKLRRSLLTATDDWD